ncbi:MAG: thioredoxin [Cyanobacteria bacterium HKST-UBA02]|nr:thioredoxin [Candidatus Melainabacteria bacterium]MCA9803455.1 thioredoxin [Cyanobacteria bacterium HKST-UBA02]
MSQVIHVDESNFPSVVVESDIPVVLDFYAPWCGPCRRLAPELDKLAVEFAGSVKIVKVNVDENSKLADAYQVRGLPTILFMKDGEVVDQHAGLLSLAQLRSYVLRLQ